MKPQTLERLRILGVCLAVAAVVVLVFVLWSGWV
jgi:hypothetical protein